MSENWDAYENTLAEIIIRTLEDEFGLGSAFALNIKSLPVGRRSSINIQLFIYYIFALKFKKPNYIHIQKIPAMVAAGMS